jgi:hypothetical protein
MPSLLLAIVARCAIVVGLAFLFSRTLLIMPNKVWRFVFLFVLCVPLNFFINEVDVHLRGHHKMGWTEASIGALLFAAIGTFWRPQPHNSTTP